MDFFEKRGVVAIASRLRRLTETLTRDDTEIYRMAGLEFRPKWFPVFLTLSDGEAHTVTSIAREIGQSHPSVSVMAREMQKAGLLEERKSATDARSTELCLSAAGRRQLPVFQELFRDVEAAALSVCRESAVDLWGAIREWEKALEKKSLLERTREIRNSRIAAAIKIVPYQECYQEDFIRLSTLWIKQYFMLEPNDEKQLADPYGCYIESGGGIFCAVDTATGKVAGVCALACHAEQGRWELAKLCVDPDYRGFGVGGKLADAVIGLARKKGATRLYLESNRILEPAIRLYRRKGFVEIPVQSRNYRRVDIEMVKELKENARREGVENGDQGISGKL